MDSVTNVDLSANHLSRRDFVVTAIVAVGGLAFFNIPNKAYAQSEATSVSELERDARFHLAKEWRWVHTSSIPYKMEFGYSTLFSHNGQRIGEEKTVKKTISFEYGDYTIS